MEVGRPVCVRAFSFPAGSLRFQCVIVAPIGSSKPVCFTEAIAQSMSSSCAIGEVSFCLFIFLTRRVSFVFSFLH